MLLRSLDYNRITDAPAVRALFRVATCGCPLFGFVTGLGITDGEQDRMEVWASQRPVPCVGTACRPPSRGDGTVPGPYCLLYHWSVVVLLCGRALRRGVATEPSRCGRAVAPLTLSRAVWLRRQAAPYLSRWSPLREAWLTAVLSAAFGAEQPLADLACPALLDAGAGELGGGGQL